MNGHLGKKAIFFSDVKFLTEKIFSDEFEGKKKRFLKIKAVWP